MSRVGNFDAFYHGTRASLLHQTYALTGNIDGAASAVEHGYAHAWSQWAKVAHLDDPLAWVRNEAWRAVSSQLPKRPFRGRRARFTADIAESEYSEHLRRLHTLPMSQRRVVVLHYLAGMPADQIARQVGVATSAAANALVGGEGLWVASAEPGSPANEVSLRQALRDLEVDTSRVTLTRASAIRRAGDKRQRRHTLIGVAAAAALLVGGGSLISQQTPTSTEAAGGPVTAAGGDDDTPSSEALSTSPEPDEGERKVSSSDTLSLVDMRTLTPQHNQWAITLDSSGPLNKDGAYTICQRRTLADPSLEQIVLRQYEAMGRPSAKALQVIEQSESSNAAAEGFAEMESWFAACQQPDVRLQRTLDVEGVGDEARIVVLRQDGRRPTYSTVGIVRTGKLSTAVIATTSADRPVPPLRLATRLGKNIDAVCELGEGTCAGKPTLEEVPPLPQPKHPGFLTPTDLPPVGDIKHAWAGTRPQRAVKDNPSDTPCDQVGFNKRLKPQARVFVIPEARRIPRSFGLSETVARFPKPGRARAFIERTQGRVDGCTDREINARVAGSSRLDADGMYGRIWKFEFEVSDGDSVTYRVGLVQRGAKLAQVTFSPTEQLDISSGEFRRLVLRAGERLHALP